MKIWSESTFAMASPAKSVAVCIATFRRPGGLEKLLESLQKLEFRKSCPPAISVNVVDNDPNSGVAAEVCNRFQDRRFKPRYVTEPQLGISFARNTGVDHAVASQAETIAFIDDDEIADVHWLDELLFVQQQHNADVVGGPVVPIYDTGVPEWVVRSQVFDRPRFPTGTSLSWIGTGNLLMTAALLRRIGRPFDERFGRSGGEDTHLSVRLRRAAARMSWCDEAIVREHVPAGRGRAGWILARAFAGGNNWVRAQNEFQPTLHLRLMRMLKAVGDVVLGILLVIPSLFAGRHLALKSAIRVCSGLGVLSSLSGFQYKRYGHAAAE